MTSSAFENALKSSAPLFHYRFSNKIIIAITISFMLTLDTATHYNIADAEYFSSVDSLPKLKDIEMGFVKAFEDYLDVREKELESYSKFIEHVKMQHRQAIEDTEEFLGNPINAFTLIKRLVTDWNYLHKHINSSQARADFHQSLQQINKTQELPDNGELSGAAKGLARLQRVYKLNTIQLADGIVNGINFGTKLTWHDCFEIAVNLYDEKDFEFALKWFQVTLQKLKTIQNSQFDKKALNFEIETLEYLALTSYEMGDIDEAVYYIELLLELEPNHHTKNIRDYMLNSEPKKQVVEEPEEWFVNYTRLCRGEQLPDKNLLNLMCKLETRDSPHFLLAPLRVEEVSRDPEINLYHGLLNDKQISSLIAEAKEKKMFRSLVQKHYGVPKSGSIVADVRVSQQVWLTFRSPIMKTVQNMVADITGLDMYNAEYLQMANYGIGGQYEPHTDFFGPACFQEGRWLGDRIVTNMFYLSDVEQGGYTVFPRINLYARPVKGALIVWYNLHRSLDGDHRMMHAGCPVLKGSKRIGNIWIHAQRQEFRRPCLLKSDTVKSAGYKPIAWK